MAFPDTVEGLKKAGYTFEGEGTCGSAKRKGCGASIEWWKTRNGKNIPMDPGTARVHWDTCPQSDNFRGSGSGSDEDAEPISVKRVRSGSCRFDGEPAAMRIQIGRDFAFLCESHGEQLTAKCGVWGGGSREPGSDDVPSSVQGGYDDLAPF